MQQTRLPSLKIVVLPGDNGYESDVFKALLPDETVSSWVGRHHFLRLISDDSHDLHEKDFGTLDVDIPAVPQQLFRDLHRAAEMPDAWMLQPWERTFRCPRCVAEDWACGLPFYKRRAWAVGWKTCCQRHGMLFDTAQGPMPEWPYLLTIPFWSGNAISVKRRSRFDDYLVCDLRGDRRAIHLEGALTDGMYRATWFPSGLDDKSLRVVYQAMVTDLLRQFGMGRRRVSEEMASKRFNCELNSNRFTVNVLAEAILSKWTNTPLPDCASAQRTDLLVRTIGWGEERPTPVQPDQVLFRGPYERFFEITRYEGLLGASLHQKLPTLGEWGAEGHVTLMEARELGMSVSRSLRWIDGLVREGQFLAFDTRTGCLTENPALPERCRLHPHDAIASRVLLPPWATTGAYSAGKNDSQLS